MLNGAVYDFRSSKMVRILSVCAAVLLFVVLGKAEHAKVTPPVADTLLSEINPSRSSDPTQRACPDDMVEVKGEYCPAAEEVCLRWVDRVGKTVPSPKPGTTGRCGEYEYPTRCRVEKVHVRYCIDQYEYPNVKGKIPQSWMSWEDTKSACEKEGKRLCSRPEWTFACEGPDMQPYPYGDGYHRNSTSCNTDHDYPDKLVHGDTKAKRDLDSFLVPSGSMPECVSPFDVYDQVGNIDEEVLNPSGQPYRSGLMGGHEFGMRNACRPMTEAHNEVFSWYETGARCCSDTDE